MDRCAERTTGCMHPPKTSLYEVIQYALSHPPLPPFSRKGVGSQKRRSMQALTFIPVRSPRLYAQFVEAQSIHAPMSLDHAQLIVLLLASGRPTPNIPFFRTFDFMEPLVGAV